MTIISRCADLSLVFIFLGRKVPEGELCAVCMDRATGYHYGLFLRLFYRISYLFKGVASCNGCKTFFRRTIVSDHNFVCQYNGNCDVNKNVRCACRHCRFKKKVVHQLNNFFKIPKMCGCWNGCPRNSKWQRSVQ